ncbi:MAG: aspartate kinase [Desulfurococcales archaeon]|nr:aspartate kinase [Desulfurococcales archaeon]
MKYLKVVKIGGSLLKNGGSYLSVAEKIREKFIEQGSRVVTVVSAMNGVTDDLIRSLAGSESALGRVVERYISAAEYLGGRRLKDRVEDELRKLKLALEVGHAHDPALRDLVLSFGEKLSKTLLVEALHHAGVMAVGLDATEIIKTDGTYGNALIKYRETLVRLRSYVIPLLEEGATPVIEGFVGSTLSGGVTTLGRGGSDYTATAVAALLRASEVHIITDVPGIMSADPRYVKSAHVVPEMSYREAIEASLYGCKRLHPRTFHPLTLVHECRVYVGSWGGSTLITKISSRCCKGPKLVTFKLKGRYAYVALVGDGVSEHGLVSKVVDLLKYAGLQYEGIYAFMSRPSIVLMFEEQVLGRALNTLHDLVVEG